MASVPPPIPNPNYYAPRRRSIFGPIVLITIGVVFLLVNAGFVTFRSAVRLFAEYWPLLLIIWGVLRLIEYLRARQEGVPPQGDRKSTRLNSSHIQKSRMPSSA